GSFGGGRRLGRGSVLGSGGRAGVGGGSAAATRPGHEGQHRQQGAESRESGSSHPFPPPIVRFRKRFQSMCVIPSSPRIVPPQSGLVQDWRTTSLVGRRTWTSSTSSGFSISEMSSRAAS